jgi:iron complex outermembrane receptor protein
LSIEANVATLRAQFDDFREDVGGTVTSRNGNQPINVPERAANFWLTHAPHAQWRWGIGARYVGKRYADNANTIEVPAYTVLDAFVSYMLTPSLTLSLRGRNLGDRGYAIASYYTNTQFILGEPRAFELVAEARF